MHMPDFIEAHLEQILQEWEQFAKEQRPAALGLSSEELRNFAARILLAVAKDMRTHRSEAALHGATGSGHGSRHLDDVAASARSHAADRLAEGFTLKQLVAEYRSLRSAVTRRWRAGHERHDQQTLEELVLFNESIDESLSVSVGWYHARIEEARELLNGVLAHDLRSPLGAIVASIELFLRDDTMSDRQTRTALLMRKSAARMRRMIDDLLDFTRTRLGTGLPMAIAQYDMAAMVREVCEEQLAFHRGAHIACETRGTLTGYWDHARINQMLGNLIENAVKHGGGSPVTVIAAGRDDEVTIEVHNERGSIPDEQQQAIFDPLRLAVAANEDMPEPADRGIGLGLYIARQIAEAHDGVIDLRSSEGEGTTFTVRLPRQRRQGAASAGLT